MEKGKISAVQMGIIMHPAITATAILLVPAITAHDAKQDMWISPFWASLVGFLTVYIAVQLHNRYPQKTVIEYSEQIVGKFLGKIVSFIFLFFYLHVTGIIVREYGEFIVGNFFVRTPLIFVMGSMIFVCAFAVRGGVEIIGRLSELIVPIVMTIILFLLFC
ncbi:spore germination protein (amino acid permease) [Anoxybacillus tepidamans]|uniref:Spore germination protein (Amino acid permease) n=1 Tax=Anoxybacteroides tepidamans TaxID=265948 RepID=A0A7W8IPE8_9BACL|nr:spore germination protein (amino acid permease) [Anoxybacillus tepidamans]